MMPDELYEGFAYPAGSVQSFINTASGLFTMSLKETGATTHFETKYVADFKAWLLAGGAVDLKEWYENRKKG